ncbi:MAG: DUF4255 domain-containing protein [Ardenticatenaceae bacterium]|nr:DUF4255 domain-containing protein [Anaerolineales bacterium]MCB8919549.1 DUF4255 domain-containing protein [Ardenticatenaceae bacterium]
MIADLDETIRQLLIAEIPIRNGEIDIKFDQPKREWSARLTRPTINFFLYDVRENVILRRHQWEKIGADGNGGAALRAARLKRTPFRVDCHYMMTTWATEPEDEHRLLSASLMALFRHPVLPEERLVGGMRNQPYELQVRLASHDKLTNPAEVWGALDNEIRPSISYIVTLALDPWVDISIPFARTVTLRTGQMAPGQEGLLPGAANEPLTTISGTIVDKSRPDEPRPGVQVAIKGTGHFATTDAQGRFRLGSLLDGEYTLVAWPQTGPPLEKKIVVPAPNGDYDLAL